MGRPTLGERLRLLGLGIGRVKAAVRAQVPALPILGLPLLRPVADELAFVPSDLRTADAGLADELAAGQLGLAGLVYDIGRGSPFALGGAEAEWRAELHGFGWLGGLRASGAEDAADVGRRLVADWCRRQRGRPGGRGIAARPDVLARRVNAWIVNAGFLLDAAPADFHRTYSRALGGELRALDRSAALAAPGLPRLAAAMALLLACLSVKGHDRSLPRLEAALLGELARQILPDGGHVSRNADVVVEVLLDLLPVRQCYAARGLEAPAGITEAVRRMMGALRAQCGTTRALARFNGVGVSRADALATVLALDDSGASAGTLLGASGYARLRRGASTLIADCGPPPPLEHATAAEAGCLSFELSHADQPVIVNRGAPSAGHRRHLHDSRATSSHTTLTVADQSSARIVRSALLETLTGAPPISGPDRVEARLEEAEDGTARLVASHDGYVGRFSLVHERALALRSDGRLLDGEDRLRGQRGTLRLARDVPFAVHFHLPPEATTVGDADGVVIELPGGQAWRLQATGAHLSIEAATDFAQVMGPTPARQIVLRATCPGEAKIAWRLERL